jgi:flagellar biosynthesis/type III secretory pathway M-ring protein FliF/YscJ
MDAWVWIVIIVAAVIVIAAIAWFANRNMRERRLAKRRAQAQELRREASAGFGRAQERQALADEQATRAERERVTARRTAERAHRIDPDTE